MAGKWADIEAAIIETAIKDSKYGYAEVRLGAAPAWEVRHREWLSHPDGQVEIFELRQDHNSSSHFAIFTARGEDGEVVEWSNVWEQTLATLPAALKIMSEYVHLSLDSTLCEVGMSPTGGTSG